MHLVFLHALLLFFPLPSHAECKIYFIHAAVSLAKWVRVFEYSERVTRAIWSERRHYHAHLYFILKMEREKGGSGRVVSLSSSSPFGKEARTWAKNELGIVSARAHLAMNKCMDGCAEAIKTRATHKEWNVYGRKKKGALVLKCESFRFTQGTQRRGLSRAFAFCGKSNGACARKIFPLATRQLEKWTCSGFRFQHCALFPEVCRQQCGRVCPAGCIPHFFQVISYSQTLQNEFRPIG
jgi:hypothetical protein